MHKVFLTNAISHTDVLINKTVRHNIIQLNYYEQKFTLYCGNH